MDKLRKALAEKTASLKELQEKAFAETATKADADALTAALDEIEAIKEKIALAERAEKAIAASAAPAGASISERGTIPAQPAATNTAQKLGLVMAGMIKGYKDTGIKGTRGLVAGLTELGHEGLANEYQASMKALNSVSAVNGGIVIGENFAPDILPLLYPMSSFMAGNPTIIPMPSGSYRQSGGATGATASYGGEGDDISVSQPTFRDLSMTAHKLSGIVPITNELIQYSLGAAETFARNDLAMAMSTAMDTKAYLGTGTGDDPKGILLLTGGYSTAAVSSTTPTQAQVDTDARKLLNIFARYPILRGGLAWRMSVYTKGYLEDMKDGNGNYIYPELRGDNPMWKGLPVKVAGTFPENLGGGTNETYLSLISFGSVVVGDAKGLTLAVSDEASIKVSGNDVSMFSTDSTAIRAIMSHDFNTRYEEAVATLTGVKWGR